MDARLQSQLTALAHDQQRWRRARGLAIVWTAATGLALGLLLLHRFTGWTSGWALFVLATGTAGIAGMVRQRSRATAPDFRALARRVEGEFPELHARLLTAIEQQPAADGELSYLQQRVIAEALEHQQRSPWNRGWAERLFAAQSAQWIALACFVLVLVALPSAGPKGRRGESARSNGVEVTPGDTTLERGSGLVVLARFGGSVPSEATLVVTPANEPERRLVLAKNLADPVFGGGVPEVRGELKYHVEFPSGRTRDFKVTVFDFPRLERADARITYPTYTEFPEKLIPDTRRVSAVEGSTLEFAFFLNKPVVRAQWVARDQPAVALTRDTNNASVYRTRLVLELSRRYELLLVDAEGRTNKVPPEFVLEALPNRPPELKLAFPHGDTRVSPLEEIAFQAEASDDFGLRAYGIGYTLAGGETRTVALGGAAGPHEKRPFNYVLPLEGLDARPDQLLSYFVWAEDVGSDGQVRRSASDLFFAEIRPFEEIFREAQAPESDGGNESSGNQPNPSEKLAELQKQIISATWNLKRRETAAKPTAPYRKDAEVVYDSQRRALEQARALKDRVTDPRSKGFVTAVEDSMAKAAGNLNEAAVKNSVAPLPPALADEQAAYQALLKLQAREYQVSRANRNQRGGGGGGSQRAQQQLDQLELKQTENRYETQRQAAPAPKPEQREQVQVASRLKELAERQQDLNTRLKELQAALPEAPTEQAREEIRQQLKRLREEQQELVADVDELAQRMARPENQSRMAEARQQLDQARQQLQKAADALEQQSAPQALASGTRAQRELQQLQEDFRKKNSGQFAEDLRRMRDEARRLAQDEEQIGRQLADMTESRQKTLDDSAERRALADKLANQKNGLTNLFTDLRQVSEQSETSEPLLSKQLYDTLRQTGQDELNKAIDSSAELVQRGFVPQAGQFEERVRKDLDGLKREVEHAAENVLGDDTEALRLAKRELEDLSRQLDNELAQEGAGRGTNGIARAGGGTNGPLASAGGARPPAGAPQESAEQSAPVGGEKPSGSPAPQPGTGAGGGTGSATAPNQPGQNPAQRAANGQGRQPGGGQSGDASGENATAGRGQANGAQPGGPSSSASRDGGAEGGGGGGGGANQGPLFGGNFTGWSERLRDVEEMVDAPDLRTEIARIRDRARGVRSEFKRTGTKPDWAVVRTQIAGPLAEVRTRVGEELARRASKDALVPLDRDPVPARFSEQVRRYYEQLGKSE